MHQPRSEEEERRARRSKGKKQGVENSVIHRISLISYCCLLINLMKSKKVLRQVELKKFNGNLQPKPRELHWKIFCLTFHQETTIIGAFPAAAKTNGSERKRSIADFAVWRATSGVYKKDSSAEISAASYSCLRLFWILSWELATLQFLLHGISFCLVSSRVSRRFQLHHQHLLPLHLWSSV